MKTKKHACIWQTSKKKLSYGFLVLSVNFYERVFHPLKKKCHYHTLIFYNTKRTPFDCIARASGHHLFTSAIPLLLKVGTFACCVSALGRYVPHYRTRYIENSFPVTMLTLSLVRTPDRHRQLATSGPELKPFVRLASK